MKLGDQTTHIINRGKKTTEVVTKTFVGRMKGKAKFSSQTRHVLNKNIDKSK